MENNKNDMNPNVQVTNWMLYELIRDFKDDVNRRFDEFDRKFEAVDKRFEGVEKRLEAVEKRLGDVEERVSDLYIHRDQITVKFTRAWASASLFMAILASMMALAAGRAFL